MKAHRITLPLPSFSAFCEPSAVPADFRMLYGWAMASDRMTQAIATLERAISRLEQDLERLSMAAPPQDASGIDASAARAALQSLDSLITELKGRTSG